MATEQEAKKFKHIEEETDLLRDVVYLRSAAPEQYLVNLIKCNVHCIKSLKKVDTAITEPFAPTNLPQPYPFELKDGMFEKRTSKAIEIQRKAENITKCMAMRRER